MEQRIVSKDEAKYVYWIKNNDDVFYLTIPVTRKASLVLNLLSNVDDNVIGTVKEEKDYIIVTPVLSYELVNGLKQNSADAFGSVAESLARDINLSYKILTYNKIELNGVVQLNPNQEFAGFSNWFITKHNGKVIFKEVNRQEEVVSSPLVEAPAESVPQPVMEDVHENESAPIVREKSLGFVSYVLLGVVVMIASLLFLYFIL